MKIVRILFYFIITSHVIWAQIDHAATVITVHDGDSYRVRFKSDSTYAWIRLVSVDCPEVISNRIKKNQPMGVEIGNEIRSMISGREVIIRTYGFDGYGRLLSQCIYNDTVDLSEYILAHGYGVYISSKIHPVVRKHYKEARTKARLNKVGIWNDDKFITPYLWRKKYKK